MSIEPRSDLHPSQTRATEGVAGALTPAQIARRGFVLASLGFLAACASAKPTKSLASGSQAPRGDSLPAAPRRRGSLALGPDAHGVDIARLLATGHLAMAILVAPSAIPAVRVLPMLGMRPPAEVA